MRRSATKTVLQAAATVSMVWLVYLFRGNVWFRLYTVVITGAVLAAFALSLRGTPLVERFARRMGASLDAGGREYCRKATVAWTVFLAAHFAVTVATVFLSLETWALYNGCIAYVLIGAMFLGEFAVRRVVRHG